MSYFDQSDAVLTEQIMTKIFNTRIKHNENNPMKQPFEEIAIGERVWSIIHGWGTITKLYPKWRQFSVGFDIDNCRNAPAYNVQGHQALGKNNHQRTLFWEEQTMKEQFTNVKVGDRVWSINYSWGEVISVKGIIFRVSFPSRGAIIRYYFSGIAFESITGVQTLFWDIITIDPPLRPCREVTHTIERWLNMYKDGDGCLYNTKEKADSAYNINHRIACVRLTGTYTTMEEG